MLGSILYNIKPRLLDYKITLLIQFKSKQNLKFNTLNSNTIILFICYTLLSLYIDLHLFKMQFTLNIEKSI